MAAIIEVKYFNTFLLKKVNKAQNTPSPGYGNIPVWNGSMGIPAAKGGYPRPNGNAVPNNWVIEESRINGGYNNTTPRYQPIDITVISRKALTVAIGKFVFFCKPTISPSLGPAPKLATK